MREYRTFQWKDASLRICSGAAGRIADEAVRLREILESYIALQPEFASSLVPVKLLPGAPEICLRMARAAEACGVGPMAAVAGAVAQMCVEAALAAGAAEAIVDNGGDLYIASPAEVVVGLHMGDHPLSGTLAFRIPPTRLPVSVCSSSSRFGHSFSFGDCDLATIVAREGALADAAATLAGNSVKDPGDMEPSLARIMAIPGIDGVLLVKGDRIAMMGDLPPLVRNAAQEAAR